MDARPTTVRSHRRRKRAPVGRFALTAGAAVVCALGVTGALDPSSRVTAATGADASGADASGLGAAAPASRLGILSGPVKASVKAVPTAVAKAPAWTENLPASTTQAVRTVRTDQWCSQIWCTRTEAWEKVDGVWRIASRADGRRAVFRSQVGQNGFASAATRRQGDMRTPAGVYGIVTTFSTTKESPTAMAWRRRLPTSAVSDAAGTTYNTWVEINGGGGGDRRMMSWGLWIDWNNPRLEVGKGPKPVPGRGSGIFMHTSNLGRPFVPTPAASSSGTRTTWRGS